MRILSLVLLVLAATGCDSNDPQVRLGDAVDPNDPTQCLEGITTGEDLISTTSQPASVLSTVVVSYVGTLTADGVEEEFDSSSNISFSLGGVVAGFRQGIGGRAATDDVPALSPMRIGERRIITIPPNLGYGYNGRYDAALNHVIPRCATLTFDVTLLDLR